MEFPLPDSMASAFSTSPQPPNSKKLTISFFVTTIICPNPPRSLCSGTNAWDTPVLGGYKPLCDVASKASETRVSQPLLLQSKRVRAQSHIPNALLVSWLDNILAVPDQVLHITSLIKKCRYVRTISSPVIAFPPTNTFALSLDGYLIRLEKNLCTRDTMVVLSFTTMPLDIFISTTRYHCALVRRFSPNISLNDLHKLTVFAYAVTELTTTLIPLRNSRRP